MQFLLGGVRCVSFLRHMFGRQIGFLRLFFKETTTVLGTGEVVGQFDGNSGDEWISEQLTVTSLFPFRVSGLLIYNYILF